MIIRELKKGKQDWRVVYAHKGYGSTSVNSSNREIEYCTPTWSEFTKQFKNRISSGWTETEASFSRRVFLQDSDSDGKFWIIRLDGDVIELQYGKLPSYGYTTYAGQTKQNYFDSADEARIDYHKQIQRKMKDGYEEFKPRKTEYDELPERLKTMSKQKTRKTKPSTTNAASNNCREFVFQDGKSHKFWKIELDGKSHTVQYGRVGTNGQTKTKEFASDDAARKSYEKLIEQKTAKGYVEQSSTTATSKAKATAHTKKSKKKTSETNAAVSVVPPKPAPPVVTKVTHRIDLAPKDWFWAMWRDPEPLPKPEPRPFDKEACLEAIRSVRSARGSYSVPIPDGPFTPQEAEFWMVAQHLENHHRSPGSLCDALAKKEFNADWTAEKMARRQEKDSFRRTDLVAQVLGPEQFAELILIKRDADSEIVVFRRHALPYLDRKLRENLRQRVEKSAQSAKLPKRYYDDFPAVAYLAAILGCSDFCKKILHSVLPSGHWYSYQMTAFLWGLGSAQDVEEEADRLRPEGNWRLQNDDIRPWLAHTELRRLDILRDSILSTKSGRGDSEALAEFARVVKDPAAAPIILEARLDGVAANLATEWLDEQIGNAIAGLVSVAAGKGQLADAARAYLRERQRLGYGTLVEKGLDSLPAVDAQRLRETVLNVTELGPPLDGKTTPKTLAPLFAETEELKRLKGSDWAVVDKLPPISIGKFRLAPGQVDALLLALQHSKFGHVQPLLTEIREQADTETLAEFAWALFDLWLANNAPSRHKWAMRALGFLGDDNTALKLTPLVRKWPGESQHPRAVLGLDCLRAIGSDVALMQLSGIAQKVKFKGLQNKAMECVQAIAEEKGMTRDELEDRVVPDCGLDETGSRTFDFGPRRFRFALDSDNKPVIRDEDGKLRKDLPKPATKDDTQKATQSIDDWKHLKKQIRDVVKVQTTRLEQALITGRRWSVPNFESLLVRHPLMTNFARRLLWGGFDSKDKLRQMFRVTEECDFADVEDNVVSLDNCDTIGIVHPLHLNEDEHIQWGELFADYEIIPPFPQLGRPVHRLSAAENKQLSFTRFEGLKVPALTLLGILNRHGWTRGIPQDNGVFQEHYKHFYASNLTASIHYEYGIGISMYGEEEDQTLEDCLFLRGIYKPTGWPQHRKEVALGSVDPVIVSEVISDLKEIEAKAI